MENVALKRQLCVSGIGWSSAVGCEPLKWHSDYKNVLIERVCTARGRGIGTWDKPLPQPFRSILRHRLDGVRFLFQVAFLPTFCHLDCSDRWQCYFPNPIVLFCGFLCWHLNFAPCQLSCTESFAKISTTMTRYVGCKPACAAPPGQTADGWCKKTMMEGQGDRGRAFLQTLEEKELTMQLLGQYRHCLNSKILDVYKTEQTCVSQNNLQFVLIW